MDFQQLVSYSDNVAVVECCHGLSVFADSRLQRDGGNVGNGNHAGSLVFALVLQLLRGSLLSVLTLQSSHVVATVRTLHDSWSDGISAAQTTCDLDYGRLFFFAADGNHYCFLAFVVEIVHKRISDAGRVARAFIRHRLQRVLSPVLEVPVQVSRVAEVWWWVRFEWEPEQDFRA